MIRAMRLDCWSPFRSIFIADLLFVAESSKNSQDDFDANVDCDVSSGIGIGLVI